MIAIIGAGVSGLAVASALSSEGRSVTVLEATDRIGGRLKSVPISGGFADLGATWFWPGEQRVTQLVTELELPVHEQWCSGDAMVDPSGADPYRYGGNPLDVPSYRFTGGAQSITDGLARLLPPGAVRLNAAVHSITAAETGVQILLDNGDVVAASAAVLALPPAIAIGMLGSEAPDDLTQLCAATPTWMGHTVKVVVTYHRPFWRDDDLAGSAMSQHGPLQEIHDMSGPDGRPAALFGFALSRPGESINEDEVVHQLIRIFGAEAAHATDIIVTDWADRSPADGHQFYGHAFFGQPHWDGRLFFTSTETSPVAPGHIEGALAAAERTVRLIAEEQASVTIAPIGTVPE